MSPRRDGIRGELDIVSLSCTPSLHCLPMRRWRQRFCQRRGNFPGAQCLLSITTPAAAACASDWVGPVPSAPVSHLSRLPLPLLQPFPLPSYPQTIAARSSPVSFDL